MDAAFDDNSAQNRFEYRVGDAKVIANYRKDGNTLYIDYVEAPPALRGTGASGKIMQNIKDLAQSEGLDIVPICGYAAAWLQKHR